jgi:Skp family chaperone for outer membrane proteins
MGKRIVALIIQVRIIGSRGDSMTKRLFILFSVVTGSALTICAQVRPTPTPTPARPMSTPTTARPTPTPAPTRPSVLPTQTPQPTPNLVVAVPVSKIAVVDTAAFGDEKVGIFRVIDANTTLQNEFRARQQELQSIQTRINTLVEDIRKLRQANPVDQKAIQAKQEEGIRLQQDFDTKKQRYEEDYGRRYGQVMGPVSQQIGRALDEFAAQHGITMTLDVSKLLPAVLTALPTVEVTAAFIADFNRKNPRGPAVTRP